MSRLSSKFFLPNLTSNRYLDQILNIPLLTNKSNDDYLTIQDNDPKHNSEEVYHFMIQNKFNV